jgi:anti-anti-sigma factor
MPCAVWPNAIVYGPAVVASPVIDRVGERFERWVAGNLGLAGPVAGASLEDWHDQIAAAASLRGVAPKAAAPARQPRVEHGWTRLSIARRREVTIARLRPRTLLKPSELGAVAEEIVDLIEAGHRRIALDFAAVERMSIVFVPVLAEASRRCQGFADGALRVFNLRPELAELLQFAAEPGSLVVQPDEAAVLEGPWPERAEVPALPDAVLLAVQAAIGRHDDADAAPAGTDAATGLLNDRERTEPVPRLIFESGRTRGRGIAIDDEGFLIGRDPTCRVRLNDNSISRRHATVRRRDGRVLLRDLGSRNGTLLNDRLIQDEEVEVRHGDRLRIGSRDFTFALDAAPSGECPPDEDEILSWLGLGGDEGAGQGAELATLHDSEARPGTVRCEVIEGVLVVTPFDSQLVDEASLEPLRAELLSVLERPLPRRMVLNLEHVGRITGAALGMIVAQHLRLDRKGGELRLCQAQPRVRAVLDQVRLPVLMDVFPNVEDAVLTAWSSSRGTGS